MTTCTKCLGRSCGTEAQKHCEEIRREDEYRDREPLGMEEGDTCNRLGCDGAMEYPPSVNCFCHISPPCSECTDKLLTCNKCGYEVER